MRSCLFFLPFFLVACGDGIESSSVRRLDVDHFLAPCPTESTELCLIVRAEGINDFGYWSRPIDGFTHQEIADRLHISVGTSKSNLSKARVFLQKILKNNDLEVAICNM